MHYNEAKRYRRPGHWSVPPGYDTELTIRIVVNLPECHMCSTCSGSMSNCPVDGSLDQLADSQGNSTYR